MTTDTVHRMLIELIETAYPEKEQREVLVELLMVGFQKINRSPGTAIVEFLHELDKYEIKHNRNMIPIFLTGVLFGIASNETNSHLH